MLTRGTSQFEAKRFAFTADATAASCDVCLGGFGLERGHGGSSLASSLNHVAAIANVARLCGLDWLEPGS